MQSKDIHLNKTYRHPKHGRVVVVFAAGSGAWKVRREQDAPLNLFYATSRELSPS